MATSSPLNRSFVGLFFLVVLKIVNVFAFSPSQHSHNSYIRRQSISKFIESGTRVATSKAATNATGLQYPSALASATIKTTNENVETSLSKDISEPSKSYDVVIVGSGIGGLSAAAMLSLYGYSVAVFESHYAPGGCAHGYRIKAKQSQTEGTNMDSYVFDTGPSFFSGLNPTIPAKISNPLRTILDAIDEQVECIPYKTFGLKFPEGDFIHTTDFGKNGGVLQQQSSLKGYSGSDRNNNSPTSVQQWEQLMQKMKPLAAAVDAMPTAALRTDIGVAITAGQFLPNFANTNPLENLKLTQPFSNIIDDAGVTDTFTKNWLDLLCFCLSGLPASGTITAEMAMMMGEFYEPDAIMDCPKHGAKSIVDALVRGIEKNGGQIFLNSPVEKIDIIDGRATGVQLKSKTKKTIKANKAVISNLSVWDLFKSNIVDTSAFPSNYIKEKLETPVGKSFMHLHVGFKASREELEQLQAHYMYIDDWDKGIESEDNAALLSIPSVHDNTLAPTGHAVLHIYTPATEDYAKWENVSRNSPEYKELKEERSQYLWKVLETVIPDIRDRATVVQIGTPLTHQRFLRRYRGSYGPAIQAGEGSFPFPGTPVKGLLMCGDSCFPGIGVPAVAGSGILAANSVSLDSVKPQLEVLDKLKKQVAV